MKSPILPKFKIALILLVAAALLQSVAFLTLVNTDTVLINYKLYEYGLRFDFSWYNLYQDQLKMFLISLVVSTALIVASIAVIVRFNIKNQAYLTIAEYVIPPAVVCINILSIFNLTSITQIIHSDLYNFGLQYSFEWASPLLSYTMLLLTIMVLASSLTITTSFLIHFGSREAKLPKSKRTPKTSQILNAELASFILITAGTSSILCAILFSSTVLAFIGIGVLFWGILFTYIRKEEKAKNILVDSVTYQTIDTLNQIIGELNFQGKPIYLPPKYFENPGTLKVYLSKKEDSKLPTPQQIKKLESNIFNKEHSSMLVAPLGLELAKVIEKSLAANLELANFQFLERNLSRVLVGDLEIARKFEMETGSCQITVRIEYFEDFLIKNRKDLEKQDPYAVLHSIITSALACVLAKTVSHPIIIAKQETSEKNGKEIIRYQIIAEEEQKEP